MVAQIYATGVNKIVSVVPETVYGALPSPLTGAVELRRIRAEMSLRAQAIQSQEILASQQLSDARLGSRQAQGSLQGQLSPGAYGLFYQSLLRVPPTALSATVATAAMTDTTLTVQSAAPFTFTIESTATNFQSTGFRVGDVVRPTGWTGALLPFNNMNMRVTGISGTTDNILTFAPAPDSQFLSTLNYSTGQTVTLTRAGLKYLLPTTGQVATSMSVEQWYSDISVSELALGVFCTGATINIPPNGFAQGQFTLLGQNMNPPGSVQQITGAATASTDVGTTGISGKISYADPSGTAIDLAAITGINIQIQSDASPEPVVGSPYTPQIFVGTMRVTGSLSVIMMVDQMTNDFMSENDLQIAALLTSAAAPVTPASQTIPFINLWMPRVRLQAMSHQDSDRAIIRNYQFAALLSNATGASPTVDDTTIVIQDAM